MKKDDLGGGNNDNQESLCMQFSEFCTNIDDNERNSGLLEPINFSGIINAIFKPENMVKFTKTDGSTMELGLDVLVKHCFEFARALSAEFINLFDYKKAIKNSRPIDTRPENNGYWNHEPLRDLNYDRAVILCQKGEQFTVLQKAVTVDTSTIQFTNREGLHLEHLTPTITAIDECQIYTCRVPENDRITHFNVNIHKEINKIEETMVFKGTPNINYEFIPYKMRDEDGVLRAMLDMVFDDTKMNLPNQESIKPLKR